MRRHSDSIDDKIYFLYRKNNYNCGKSLITYPGVGDNFSEKENKFIIEKVPEVIKARKISQSIVIKLSQM